MCRERKRKERLKVSGSDDEDGGEMMTAARRIKRAEMNARNSQFPYPTQITQNTRGYLAFFRPLILIKRLCRPRRNTTPQYRSLWVVFASIDLITYFLRQGLATRVSLTNRKSPACAHGQQVQLLRRGQSHPRC